MIQEQDNKIAFFAAALIPALGHTTFPIKGNLKSFSPAKATRAGS
jgi:hypothetical protein